MSASRLRLAAGYRRCVFALAAALALALPASAGAAPTGLGADLGPDHVRAGEDYTQEQPIDGDAWLAGGVVRLAGRVGRHLHIGGGSVTVGAPVGGSLYAGGQQVLLGGDVGESLWAMGDTVTLRTGAEVAERARLTGNTVSVAGNVGSDLHVTAGTVRLTGRIAGDARIQADRFELGENARIDGDLDYLSAEPVGAAAERQVGGEISYDAQEAERRFPNSGQDESGGLWTAVSTLLGSVAVLLIVGGLSVVALPQFTATAQQATAERPLGVLGNGVVLLLILIAAALILGITLVGVPVLILALLAAPLVAAIAYAMGALGLASKAWRWRTGLLPTHFGARLGLMGLAILGLNLLATVPYIGWLIAVLVTLLGLGTFGRAWLLSYHARRA